MFEKLTPRMSKIIELSQHIARDYGQDYVGTEHLLLAILQEGTGTAVEILSALGVTPAKAKTVVDELIRESLEDTWVFGRLPGTPHFRNVMAKAIEEARALECKLVCNEHLLLALAREQGSVAHAALQKLGAGLPVIRREIARRLEEGCEDVGAVGPELPGTPD